MVDINRDLKLKPSVMVRAVQDALLSVDINVNFLLQERTRSVACTDWAMASV